MYGVVMALVRGVTALAVVILSSACNIGWPCLHACAEKQVAKNGHEEYAVESADLECLLFVLTHSSNTLMRSSSRCNFDQW